VPIFRVGLGGPIGRGRRWMSWISLEDEIGAIAHLLTRPGTRGAYNLVAPEPVTGSDFARELGRALGRPALFPVPVPALQAVFGQMADETLLASQRVRPARLLAEGYAFQHPGLAAALRDMLGVNRAATHFPS
jgi:NAD dependent epimerase/dehydratase family enzyme